MQEFFNSLTKKGIVLPENVREILLDNKGCTYFRSTREIMEVATGSPENKTFEVKYDVPGKGEYVEAVVHRVKNGISANYTEPYMRRRDPGTMVVADDLPSDKTRFSDKYDHDFPLLQQETFSWLKDHELATFVYFAGRAGIGSYGIVIAPANAGFFAMGLSMLQQIVAIEDVPENTEIKSSIFVAPTFRHTHFDGKQVVVHNRTDVHELYSYNLYPGPSAKKGLYGVLLNQGEKEGWVTAHCSSVRSFSPYDNMATFMHEGASGGGKSEMHQHILRENDGRILVGSNTITGEKRHITIPRFCSFYSVADDMAFCHPSVQKNRGKLSIVDAENAWFIRVDSIKEYGDDPNLESTIIHSEEPLLFLNIESVPEAPALPWNHIEDEPGKPCPNPRVVVPRKSVKNIMDKPVSVDVRSFGIRTPICTKEDPTYGIVGLFHILPPALAWLWRLVSPRGHKNPSIVGTGKMESEGVGSYWPFATGRRVPQANMLLEQIIETPRTLFTLVPNQNIGAWNVGFKPQLLMREYMTRRGAAKLQDGHYQPARCPLLGYELNYLTLESSKIPSRFLKVYNQPEVGVEGYDAGAKILQEFFEQELSKYLETDLLSTGKRIIEACLAGADVEDYNNIIPMDYSYSFSHMEDFEAEGMNEELEFQPN